jgi:hypothetical protein
VWLLPLLLLLPLLHMNCMQLCCASVRRPIDRLSISHCFSELSDYLCAHFCFVPARR